MAYSWKRALVASLSWVLGGSALGFASAVASGEHGSIVFVGLGIVAGAAGALSHALLLASHRYRSLSVVRKTVVLWLGILFILVVAAAALAAVGWGDTPVPEAMRDAVSFDLFFCAIPLLIAVPVVIHVAEGAA